jgi:2-polyprenyl-6-hydroxyphenyl methylase/3-demethylubiquinone-9 3-methyltransferase
MEKNDILLWGFSVPSKWLSVGESEYLSQLPVDLPSVEWIWAEMDRVWNLFNLDNCRSLSEQLISEFYSHPVWLMNGIFTATDPVSALHRSAIANYLSQHNLKSVADVGGGFGELALAITKACPAIHVSIVEPYPSHFGLQRLAKQTNITIVSALSENTYDGIIAQDVLEHVEDPVLLAYDIAGSVKNGGLVIFANCFYPDIQCHLPCTFHLRHTFSWVMKALGLLYVGRIKDAEHAQVFVRKGELDLAKARKVEKLSSMLGGIINFCRSSFSYVKRLILS